MGTNYGFFAHRYFDAGYFTPVWFAPADEEHLTPDERRYTAEVELSVESKYRKKRRQIIVAHNGKDYVVELDELPHFLAQIEEETKETVVKRAATKRTKKPAPVVKLVEAPEDTKQQILKLLAPVNQLIRSEWASAVRDYLAYKEAFERAQDEEDIELLLMAA